MSWIKMVPVSENDPELGRRLGVLLNSFPDDYGEAVRRALSDQTGGVIGCHSLLPETCGLTLAAFGSLLSPELPLSRRQHELIATVVSATNRCTCCADSHTETLGRLTGDESLAAKVRSDYMTAELPEADAAMLRYVESVTVNAGGITSGVIDGLRGVGFDDRAILQMTLIAAWFNYFNRVVDALGAGKTGAGQKP